MAGLQLRVNPAWFTLISMETKTVYQFGHFRLDPQSRVLLTGDKIVPLTPKALDLLLALVEKSGQVVVKDELIKTVWPDTFVEESNLSSNISILRKQLGVLPEGGEYIETIPKRGYRFIAIVTPVSGDPPTGITEVKPATRRKTIIGVAAALLVLVLAVLYLERSRISLPGLAAPPHIQTLAVLPLANLSGDPAEDYFADGMTEALTADLAQIAALRVISRTSVIQYKSTKRPLPEIARQLKVDAVVLGSVLRSGTRVRITAELILASTDRHLWARTYERDLGDILDLQNEVARAIAAEIRLKVTPQEQARLTRNRTVNPDAYEAYLKGRHFWNQFTPEPLMKSIEYFEQSVKLDPSYAAGYAGLADAWASLAMIGAVPNDEANAKTVEAAGKAIELDDGLAEGHNAMSLAKAQQWDWAGSRSESEKALALNPSYALAHLFHSNQLRHGGHADESIAEAQRALDLDPLSALTNEGLANAYLSARQYDPAILQYQKTLELFPDHTVAHDSMGWAYIYKGLYSQGLDEINKSIANYGEDPALSPELAYIYATNGQRAKAEKILQRLVNISKSEPIPSHHFVLVYAGLGRKEEALVWLEQAYQQHSPMMHWLKVDPRFDAIRPDPRFQDLMHRVGLN